MEIIKCLCVRLETRVCVESTRAMLYLAFDSMINDYLQKVFLSYEIEILQLNNKILKDLEKIGFKVIEIFHPGVNLEFILEK